MNSIIKKTEKTTEMHELFKVTQSVLFKRDGRFLILKHNSGNWLLPGGKINQGESMMDGIRREIKEELGEDFNFINLKVFETDSWTHKGIPFFGAFYIGEVDSLDEKIKLSEEHIEYAWVTVDEIKSDKYKFWTDILKDRILRGIEV